MAMVKFCKTKSEDFALGSSADRETVYFTETALTGGRTRNCIIIGGKKFSEVINGASTGSTSSAST